MLLEQIRGISQSSPTAVRVCVREVQNLNQSYIQGAIQAIFLDGYDELEEILKTYRKFRKAIASLEKTEKENFYYQAGIFNGAYKVFHDVYEFRAIQAEKNGHEELLERKHVRDILTYLYENPYARQKSIADGIEIQRNYLGELLAKLREAGYVERYGKNKNTQYVLTQTGCRILGTGKNSARKQNVYIDAEYEEIMVKEEFLNERLDGCGSGFFEKEDGYAEWEENFRADTEFKVG